MKLNKTKLFFILFIIVVCFLLAWQVSIGTFHYFYTKSKTINNTTYFTYSVICNYDRQIKTYYVNGKINNKSVHFLVDTGASLVSMSPRMAKNLGLIEGFRGQSITANGTVKIHFTQIDSITIGDIKLRNIKAIINPGMTGNTILLGMSALEQVNFTQRNNQLVFTAR